MAPLDGPDRAGRCLAWAPRALALVLVSLVIAVTTLAPAVPAEATRPPKTTSTYAVTLPVALATKLLVAPLRVGSFNVRCATCYTGDGDEKRWSARRGAVVETILGQDLDVVGVQEASQGRIHDGQTGSKNLSQFDDLLNRLGSPWQLTNAVRYNCVHAMSPNHCHYRYRGASEANRIFYNTDRLTLVAAGSAKLPGPRAKGDNYLAWAELRQRSTGVRFMFSDLHTVSEDKYRAYKKRQAAAAVHVLEAHNPDHLSMVAVGDWNSSRFERPSNGPYDVYRRAGFVDPLGGAARTSHTAPGATVETRVRTWLSSSNSDWSRRNPAHRGWINGSYIDYIMTTPMRVSEWETVARLDAHGRWIGTIPSDHDLIRATVWLP